MSLGDIESHENSIMGSITRLPSLWLLSTVLLTNTVNKSRELAGSIANAIYDTTSIKDCGGSNSILWIVQTEQSNESLTSKHLFCFVCEYRNEIEPVWGGNISGRSRIRWNLAWASSPVEVFNKGALCSKLERRQGPPNTTPSPVSNDNLVHLSTKIHQHVGPQGFLWSWNLPRRFSVCDVVCTWMHECMNAWMRECVDVCMTACPGCSSCKFTLVHMKSSQALNRFTAAFNRHLNDIQTLVPKPPQSVLAVCCCAEMCTLLQVLLKALCISFCHPGPPPSPWHQEAHSQQKVFLKGSD